MYKPFGAWLGNRIADVGLALSRAAYQRASDKRHAEAMKASGYYRTLAGWAKMKRVGNTTTFVSIKGFRGKIGSETQA
jgi:hypothetical protein